MINHHTCMPKECIFIGMIDGEGRGRNMRFSVATPHKDQHGLLSVLEVNLLLNVSMFIFLVLA